MNLATIQFNREKDGCMLKKTMIAGLGILALLAAHDVRAAGKDNGGFSDIHFSNSASSGLQDPQNTANNSAAAAAASIEPASGGGNVFTTTQIGNVSSGAAQPVAPASGNNGDVAATTTTVYP